MESPQDGRGQSTRLSSECETSGDRPLLCKWILDDIFAGRNSLDLYKAYPGALHSLDQVCEETTFLADKPFSLEGLAEALTCCHREGSFDLNPSAVALCVHLANVICLNSFLLYLRIEEVDGVDISDEVLRLSDKWKLWSGEPCKNTYHEWRSFTVSGADCEKNEAMRLLYQWTYSSLHPTFSRVDCELEKAFRLTQSEGSRSEVGRLMEWGDELCHFLRAYKPLFNGGDTEFLFDEVFHFHYNMANFHQTMGNEERRWELLEAIQEMLDAVQCDHLQVTKWDPSTIIYLDPDPLSLITRTWIVYIHEKFEGTAARQYLVREVFLWEPFRLTHWEEGVFRWYLDLLELLARSCEMSESMVSKDDELQLRLEGLKEALICEGDLEESVDLSLEDVGRCVLVANVFSFNCFLVCMRIHLDKPLIDQPVLAEELSSNIWRPCVKFFPVKDIPLVLRNCKLSKIALDDKLSRLLDKWKWSGDYCNKVLFNKRFKADLRKKVEAMKLLYCNWTFLPLAAVLYNSVEHEMHDGDNGYAEVKRVSKLGEELCELLFWYRDFFQPVKGGTEFFYDTMYDHTRHTAELLLVLGEKERATTLLRKYGDMLNNIETKKLMVAIVGPSGIEFVQPDPVTINVRKWNIYHLLGESDEPDFSDIHESFKKIQLERRGLDFNKFASDQRLIRSRFDRQLYDIIKLIKDERCSEALEAFRGLDLEEKRLNRANLRHFLVYLNRQEIMFCAGHPPISWEVYCKKQVLLLDASRILHDDQLTARFIQQYGMSIAEHSIGKLLPAEFKRKSLQPWFSRSEAPGDEFPKAQDAHSRLNHWLKEELGLQFPLPAPESVEAVISCLRDHCDISNAEHIYKHENLPNMLKACRLLKCSIDIYSDLLHKWMRKDRANEDVWLKLLESQNSGRNALQSYLVEMSDFCMQSLLHSHDPYITASDGGSEAYMYTNPKDLDCSVLTVFLGSTLVWVERGRARTLMNQLGSCYNTRYEMENPGSLKEELLKFYKDEQAALHTILPCQTESAGNGAPLFVEYWIDSLSSGDQAVAFLLHNRKIFGQLFICEGGHVEKLIHDFNKAVSWQRSHRSEKFDVKKVHSILEGLYDILIGPWSEHAWFKQLDPKATIVLVPDKMLYRVPFSLLRDKKTQKYLFQLHPIAIAPSLRVLQLCERRRRDLEKAPLKDKECILAVGNAVYEHKPLPETEVELEELHKYFPGRVKTLEEAEATRANFLEQLVIRPDSASSSSAKFAYIHLGVHGHWSENKGSKLKETKKAEVHKTGSLQFAIVPSENCSGNSTGSQPGHSSKEMLSSKDIINCEFEWRSPLAVLSACNSSRGESYDDGEINLPRALMIAGVPAAVVSQWKIDDTATPRLMRVFYESLKRGQNVAAALQSAMLQLCSEPDASDNIFDWGSFLVWGLSSVQLPQELWYVTEARQKTELLMRKFDMVVEGAVGALQVVYTFLTEAYASNSWALDDAAVFSAWYVLEQLLALMRNPCNALVLGDSEAVATVFRLAEEFHSVVPPEQLERMPLLLTELPHTTMLVRQIFLRTCIMYAQAMKGNHQTALEYADKQIEVIERAYVRPAVDEYADVLELESAEAIRRVFGDQKAVSVKQERAVVLRLMGKYEDAQREFEALLAPGEDYACLLQMSCLKFLLKDEAEALAYARRAENVKEPEYDMPGVGEFTLGMKELPWKYRKWLSKQRERNAIPATRMNQLERATRI